MFILNEICVKKQNENNKPKQNQKQQQQQKQKKQKESLWAKPFRVHRTRLIVYEN